MTENTSAEDAMNSRQRALAVLNYEPYDRLPIVHFGFWGGYTLQKWAAEGHLAMEQADAWADGNFVDQQVGDQLGFDFNWQCSFAPATRHVRNANGAVIVEKPDALSIPAEIDHLLKDRPSWENTTNIATNGTPSA
ncbi:MAG: hypothetical protein ACKVJG_18735 [Candidatus Latescibacterota bacterium]